MLIHLQNERSTKKTKQIHRVILIINKKNNYNQSKQIGTILVDIDPLDLITRITLRCFGEIYQEKLYI